jgi:acyl carrier protein
VCACGGGAQNASGAGWRGRNLLDVDAFGELNQVELGLARRPAATDLLVDDLGLDSVQMLELVMVIEDAAGVEHVSDARYSQFPVLVSVHDAFSWFEELRGSVGK